MDHHETAPSILMLHDGELADLSGVVEPLGGIDRLGTPTESDCNRIWDVIIATASRMFELHEQLPDISAVRIAVCDGDSQSHRAMLREVDTDLLVRQPVHPTALRLLILHALYRGPENRRATRVSVGAPIRFRSGLRRRPALLAELSGRGCRLMVDAGSHRAVPGRLMTIVLPPEVTRDDRPLSLRGHVVRISSGAAGEAEIAVLFELLKGAARTRLDAILAAHSHGPAMLDRAVVRTPPSDASASSERRPDPPGAGDPETRDTLDPTTRAARERRSAERHAIERRIIALGEEAARVLIGRDLSLGGMRIDPVPGLGRGDRVKVAVHIRPDGQPLVVSAEVVRDDGADGMALRFFDLSAAEKACLEELVEALPRIVASNASQDDEGVVVSELVGRHAN